uniref:Uncharacterized protein n=1 Tax=Meloidogyne incognita TaxID=6306 RepID=A0A914NUY1_MELIC
MIRAKEANQITSSSSALVMLSFKVWHCLGLIPVHGNFRFLHSISVYYVIHSTLIYALLSVQRAVAVGSTKRDLKIQSLILFHHLSFHLLAARPQRCHVLISVDEARQPKVEQVDDIRSLVTCSDICRLYVTMNEACSMKCAECLWMPIRRVVTVENLRFGCIRRRSSIGFPSKVITT